MMQTAQIREYKRRPLTPEVRDKLERCGRFIATLYSDISGHFKAKCGNCKTITIFNVGYFRRIHRRG